METLFHLVDLLSEWKINQLQLYTEHTFAYLAHPIVWEKASPMTGEEVMLLDEYCKAHFVQLVPNQNSFGHMDRWLKHAKYNPMAESPKGSEALPAFSLCPVDKRSAPFLGGLYDELLPHFTSGIFNVGCDETFDLGVGRSKEACEERGKGRVYLDFLLEIYRMASERGRTMQFWGDIILQHEELIAELPKDVIALEWGYEWDHRFAEHTALFGKSGVPFYVCPGTSSWGTLCGRTDNAIGSVANAAKHGLKNGAIGLLNTDWGDHGHWQPLSVSYLPMMAGAMVSWNAAADPREALASCGSLHAFGDPSGKAGEAFYELGNIYKVFHKRTHNSSVPWQVFASPLADGPVQDVTPGEFEDMARRVEEIAGIFADARITSWYAGIVKQEFEHLLKTMSFVAEMGKGLASGKKPRSTPAGDAAAKKRHERVWLLRNRPGGLVDSLAKFPTGRGKTRAMIHGGPSRR